MYFLSAHRTIKAGNYFSSLFPAAHWLPGPHVIVFTQKYGADQCAGAFFFFFPCLFFFFFIPSPTPFSADPRDLRFPGGPELWTQGIRHPFRTTRLSAENPLAQVHPSADGLPPPPPGGFLNGVNMPAPDPRVPGPPGRSWAPEPGDRGRRGRWRNYFLT